MLQQFNEKNRDLMVNINGQLVHRDQAGVSPFDSAVAANAMTNFTGSDYIEPRITRISPIGLELSVSSV